MARGAWTKLILLFGWLVLATASAPAAEADHLLALDGLKAPGRTMRAVVAERLAGVAYDVVRATASSMQLRTSDIGYFKLLGDTRIVRVVRLEGPVPPDPTTRVRHTAYTLRLITQGRDPLPFRTSVPAIAEAVLLSRRAAQGLVPVNATTLPRFGIEFRAVGADGTVRGSTVIEDPRTLRHEPTTSDGRHLTSATFRRTDTIVTVVIAETGPVRRIEIRNRRGLPSQAPQIGTVLLP